MHVKTLTGQTVSISQQCDQLHLMSSNNTYEHPNNILYSRKLGRQITAACGGAALMAVLNELPGYLSSDHHTALAKIWVPIAAKAAADAQDYDPRQDQSIAFDLCWGPCSYSRCQQAMVAALASNRAAGIAGGIARLTVEHMRRQGIREALAEEFLALIQEPRQRRATG